MSLYYAFLNSSFASLTTISLCNTLAWMTLRPCIGWIIVPNHLSQLEIESYSVSFRRRLHTHVARRYATLFQMGAFIELLSLDRLPTTSKELLSPYQLTNFGYVLVHTSIGPILHVSFGSTPGAIFNNFTTVLYVDIVSSGQHFQEIFHWTIDHVVWLLSHTTAFTIIKLP